MVATSAHRVPLQTASHINQRIREATDRSIAYYASFPDQIDRRLVELDREWDIERILEANAASLTLVGVTLSLLKGRQWLILPAIVGGFLLQHAVQGWCPPLPVLRRLGFRTRHEIDQERYALKAIRGDFTQLPSRDQAKESQARKTLEAIRK